MKTGVNTNNITDYVQRFETSGLVSKCLAKIKVQISCAVTAVVVCTLVFARTKWVLQSACIHWGEEKTPASIRIGKDLSFILHREKTCIRGFRPGPATAKPVCKAMKDVLNVVIARREIILFG